MDQPKVVKKGKSGAVKWVLIILLVLIIGGLAFYSYSSRTISSKSEVYDLTTINLSELEKLCGVSSCPQTSVTVRGYIRSEGSDLTHFVLSRDVKTLGDMSVWYEDRNSDFGDRLQWLSKNNLVKGSAMVMAEVTGNLQSAFTFKPTVRLIVSDLNQIVLDQNMRGCFQSEHAVIEGGDSGDCFSFPGKMPPTEAYNKVIESGLLGSKYKIDEIEWRGYPYDETNWFFKLTNNDFPNGEEVNPGQHPPGYWVYCAKVSSDKVSIVRFNTNQNPEEIVSEKPF